MSAAGHRRVPPPPGGRDDVVAVSAFGRVLTDVARPIDYGDDPVIPLDHPDHAVLVEHGELDLFAVPAGEDGTPGRWTFLFRAEVGAVLPPGWTRDTGARTVVAKPTARAYVSRVPVAVLATLSAPSVAIDDPAAEQLRAIPATEYATAVTQVTRGLEKVLVGLASALRDELPPQAFTPLDPRATVTVPGGARLRSVDGVQWVEIVTGSTWLGEACDRHVLRAGDVLCLTERDWLQTSSSVTLSSRTSQDLLAEGTLWSHVGEHMLNLLEVIDHRVARRRDAEGHDLEEYDEADERAVRSAVRGLRSVLSADAGGVGLADAAAEPPARAAVRLVAGHLGIVVPEVSRDRRVGRRMDPVRAAFLAAGLRTRSVRLEGRWWTEETGPMVARRLTDDAPVAVLPVPGGYVAAWPEGASLRPVTAQDAKALAEHALSPYRPLPPGNPGWPALLRFGVRGGGRDLNTVVLTVVLAGLAGLALPVLTGVVLGILAPRAERGLIVQAGTVLMATAVGGALFAVVQHLAVARLGSRVDAAVQAAVWDRLLSLPTTFFAERSPGEIGAAVLGVRRLRQHMSGAFTSALLAWAAGLVDLVLIIVVSPTLGLLTAVLMALALGTTAVLQRAVVRRAGDELAAEKRLSSFLLQLLQGLATVRAAAAEDRVFGRWAADFARERRAAMASRRVAARITIVAAVLPMLGLVPLFALVGGPLAGISVSSFLMVFVAEGVVLGATLALASATVVAAGTVPALRALEPILTAEPEESRSGADPGDLEGAITFTHVSFRYDDAGPLVLDDVSFAVAPGEFVAIVGPTGCGKSSLLNLLLRFGRPTTGSILLDGQDLSELDAGAVRRQCGVVLQSGTLLAGDISTNIACGGNYTREEAWEAAEMAGIADDIAVLPMGMETVVSENSSALSGGQRQRLMIARALVSKPRIVLLDEATSALDNPAQKVVAENTRKLNATRLVIAHRLSTVAGADRILVLEDGQLVQDGTYHELLADESGMFARLARRQMVSDTVVADAPSAPSTREPVSSDPPR